MLSRVIIRNILFSSQKIGKPTLQEKTWLNLNCSSRIVPVTFEHNVFIPRRMFAQQSSPDEIDVDFDYVKRATSKKDVLIVDVREPGEVIEYGKIPNSVNIPLGHLTNVLRSMPEKDFELIYDRPKPAEDTEIIFYCMIGKRSGSAQQDAVKLGFKNAKNYLGSWTDWKTKTK